MLLRDELIRQLDILQRETAPKVIVYRPVPIGFGGQVASRLEMLRLALFTGRTAIFPRVDDFPYTQIFEPMGPPYQESWQTAVPFDLTDGQENNAVFFDPLLHITRDGGSVQNRIQAGIARRLGLPEMNSLVLDGMIFDWMKPTDEVAQWIKGQQSRLNISEETLGVHVRRGDKRIETAFVPLVVIEAAIEHLVRRGDFKSLFVASDSQTTIDTLRRPPGLELIYDSSEMRYDNANHKMLMSNRDLAEQETLTAFKNICLLGSCGAIVGQDNAHFATIAAASIYCRMQDRERISLIDGRYAEKNSGPLRALFAAKRYARIGVKKVLPWMTVEQKRPRTKK
ncbi:hypothetical protein RA307_17765 [Xanthobacteraceae bacterium Astr-EGSB]|uniref:hypothetical protein n=1 Tax=Astrobacterium formosum TaxID=3069710 RepID=UPI0027B861C3|nr:hypothetical protein [Xanthobacteraceae bacterium Astr-EGSB]